MRGADEDEGRGPDRVYVLAIDLGSGGPKVGLVASTGDIVASAAGRTTTYFFPEGGSEQDPHEWWRTISEAVKEVLSRAAVPAQRIVAVSCTSMWSVIVPVDEHGEPLMNAVHWLDTRGGPYNRAIAKGFPSIQGYGLGRLLKWVRRTGMAPTHGGVDALGHMLFIKNERPEVYRKTYKFLEPMDYINLRLTGRCVSCQSNVFPMMMTDNRRPSITEYDPGLLRLAGIDKEKLPELLPNDGIVGPLLPSVAEQFGLDPSTKVILAANDNHTAAIGAGAVRDFDAVWVLGRSGFLAGHVPFKKTDILHAITTMPSPLPGRYLILAEMGNAGQSVEFFLNNVVYPNDEYRSGSPLPADRYGRLSRAAAEAPPGSGGVLFMPWLNGSLTPQENPLMRGGFLNLSHKVTRGHLSRAVLEGCAFHLRWMLGPVEKFMGRRFRFLRLGGGGALSDVWAQIHADVVGMPIHQLSDPLNANVRGAAFLAFDRLGYGSIADVPDKIGIARVYEPSAGHRELYDRLFRQFLAAYRRTEPICTALNSRV